MEETEAALPGAASSRLGKIVIQRFDNHHQSIYPIDQLQIVRR
jgi:hypothetical protein